MYSYRGLSKQEYEDYYGEVIIKCRVHGISAVDSCPACDELEDIEIEEEEDDN